MAESQRASRSTKDRHAERRRTQEDARRWAAELVGRFAEAPAEQRAAVLAELDLPYLLEEDAALELYRVDPTVTSAFIQRHLPRGRRAGDAEAPWQGLLSQAQAHGDEPLYFALYRAQASPEQWARDIGQVALRIDESQLLCAELERRHPNRWRPDVGLQLARLAQERSALILPYVMQHAHEIWSADRRSGYEQVMQLARDAGWLDLWARLLGSCATAAEYDREAVNLVQDSGTPEVDLMARLTLLADADSGPGSRRKALRDDTLLAIYARFPDLVRRAFQRQLTPSPRRPRTDIVARAIELRDDALVDIVAAHLAVRSERSGAERLLAVAQAVARYIETSASDSTALGLRAAAILSRIPHRSIRNRRELLRRNPLTRLLFERAEAACLTGPDVAAELLRAQDDQVCAIAVRALSAGNPQAAALSRTNRDLLLGALERRIPSPVRRSALRALDRLADGTAATQQLLSWARNRLAGGDTSAELLALVARQLDKHPALRQNGEQPVIYRRPPT